MALACGCDLGGGGPIDREMLKSHYGHTLQSMFIWEIIYQQGQENPSKENSELTEARCNYLAALDTRWPWAGGDDGD